jgi:hypothetical protein
MAALKCQIPCGHIYHTKKQGHSDNTLAHGDFLLCLTNHDVPRNEVGEQSTNILLNLLKQKNFRSDKKNLT